jgi:hypothetical protein
LEWERGFEDREHVNRFNAALPEISAIRKTASKKIPSILGPAASELTRPSLLDCAKEADAGLVGGFVATS